MGLMYYKPLDGGDPVPIAIGAQGEQGDKGDQGPTGPQGPQGDATKAYVDAAMPIGVIVMWSGAVAPSGWAICDGTNGTPDLSGKFVLSMGGGYALGASGGAAIHVLTTAEMPSHGHTTNAEETEHTHGGRTGLHVDGTNSSHSHPTGRRDGTGGPPEAGGWEGDVFKRHTDGAPGGYWADLNAASVSTDHQHDFSTGGRSDSHTHAVNASGSDGAHNNMPPYYVLAYIQRKS